MSRTKETQIKNVRYFFSLYLLFISRPLMIHDNLVWSACSFIVEVLLGQRHMCSLALEIPPLNKNESWSEK